MAPDDVIRDWADLAAAGTGRFEPYPYYDAETDSLTYFCSDQESYGDPVHHHLLLYRSFQDGTVTGCHLSHVRRCLVAAVRSFQAGEAPNLITLGLLLLAVPMSEAEAAEPESRLSSRDYRAAILPLARAAGSLRIRIPA